MAPSIAILEGNQRGRLFPLSSIVTTIGRDRNCSIQVEDPTISKLHCRIVCQDVVDNQLKWVITDEDSFNGTYVKNAKVKQTELRHGDLIRIGKTTLRFDSSKDTDFVGVAESESSSNAIDQKPLDGPETVAVNCHCGHDDLEGALPHFDPAQFALVGELASVVSHRVNNLLQVINGGTYMVDRGMELNDLDLIRKGWKTVKSNQARVSRVITNLIAYSRPFEPYPSDCDLVSLVREAIKNVGDAHDVDQVLMKAEAGLPKIEVDPFFTIRIFENLLAVALLAARDQGTQHGCTVKVGEQGEHLLLEIAFQDYYESLDLGDVIAPPPNKSKAHLGMIELIVSKQQLEMQGCELTLESKPAQHQHRIQVLIPAVEVASIGR